MGRPFVRQRDKTSPSGCSVRAQLRPRAWTRDDIRTVAQEYIAQWLPGRHLAARATIRFDHGFARRVAEAFHDAELHVRDERLHGLYNQFMLETRRQYDVLAGAGLLVKPWRQGGQPYESADDLMRKVLATRTLYVYLTAAGHGPTAAPSPAPYHPLRAYSGVDVEGVPLTHNDIFRAVHDIFGHVMLGNGFDASGEFLATYSHQCMYARAVRPVIFCETVGQICWFYYGPHLRDEWGRQARPGTTGFIRPAQRPYPLQKVTLLPDELQREFDAIFDSENRHAT